MYSGTTFHSKSGHIVGVHQRIDRMARRNFHKLRPDVRHFPSSQQILHFEGNHGPDGIKRKSPGVDEPWHFIDPTNSDDTQLTVTILDHRDNLVEAIRAQNDTRAAFEAAWLAHAIVDGLTPAHHYPLSDKIEELWGKPKEERISIADKNIIKGVTARDSVGKNWQYWGAKGVFATHVLFEWGVASSMTTHRFVDSLPTEAMRQECHDNGIDAVFLQAVHSIYDLNMYEEFWKSGWTSRLATHTRRNLLPLIIQVVTLAWLDAYERAQEQTS